MRGKSNLKYTIITLSDNHYRVKQKFGPFKFFIRKGFKPIEFYSFASVVKYVVERKRQDKMQEV